MRGATVRATNRSRRAGSTVGTLLETVGLTKRFGGLVAVQGLDLTVEERTIASIIGPNGAGKTTLFNLIAGLYHPSDGRILLRGREITTWRPHEVTRAGI